MLSPISIKEIIKVITSSKVSYPISIKETGDCSLTLSIVFSMKVMRKWYLTVCFLMISGCILAQAPAKGDSLSWKNRVSFHTNVVEWVMTTPNATVEWDLSPHTSNRFSVLLGGYYNWNTSHSINPRVVYNVGGVMVEGRKYWRTSDAEKKLGGSREEDESWFQWKFGKANRDTTLSWPVSVFRKIRRNTLSGQTMRNPRTWRAYYIGAYAGWEKFTWCLGRDGRQGDSYNAGLTAGWSIPLYGFKRGFLDLDLGCAVGLRISEYDTFRYIEDGSCYSYTGHKARHVVPYPVIQDLRVSLVYRFRSIREKVQGGRERYKRKIEIQDSLTVVRRQTQEREDIRRETMRDSIAAAKAIQEKKDSLLRLLEKKMKKERKEGVIDTVQDIQVRHYRNTPEEKVLKYYRDMAINTATGKKQGKEATW